MGEVHLARDEASGQLAALKLVRPDHLWFENARTRFRREIQATAQLQHPDIVRVLAVGEEHGVPWLAMEWVGGASLDQVLERLRGVPPESLRPQDFGEAVRAAAAERLHAEPARDGAFPGRTYVEVVTRLVARVAHALAHAHEAGVLHRDVKPSNVLVTPAGRVLLADFGLALPRGADRMTRTGSWLGSLPYAAPEQIDGSPRALDGRADVYSLGATFYELVTLRTPFLGGPESAVRRRVATSDLEAPRRLNSSLAPDLERICLAALDPDPRRRPRTGAEMAEDLQRALAGRPVRARMAPHWLRVQRWARRRPGRAAAAVIGALVAFALIGIAARERALASRLTRLADAELVRGLEAEAREFWPGAAERLVPMDAWLARAEELLARRPEHQRAFDELSARALPYAAEDRVRDQAATREDLTTLAQEIEGLARFVARGDRFTPPPPPTPDEVRAQDAATKALLAQDPEQLVPALRARVDAVRAVMKHDAVRWRPDIQQLDDFERMLDRAEQELYRRATVRFDDALDAWRHDALRRLLGDLDRLALLVPRVRAQREETVELARLAAGAGADAWTRARASIAASKRYGGLSLEPIFGLVPLGEDPSSGLYEFLIAETGEAPARTSDLRWNMDENAGAVLVLLPGGRFLMGQRDDEGKKIGSAQPVHEVELAPFFISKFELSVAQAERLGGFPPEKIRPADGRMPLFLDWERTRVMLRAHGLEIPTEAQWEYAARGGASGTFELEGYANVLDLAREASLREEGARQDGVVVSFDDGFGGPAPIGSLRPNAFGLHDVLGNASEWCLDHWITRGYSTLAPRAGDGLRATVVSAQLRVVRGGSFNDGANLCHPAMRTYDAPGKMNYMTGVRPVRSISPR
jgi:formylglycine-generating enzyme required for sulfatase activity